MQEDLPTLRIQPRRARAGGRRTSRPANFAGLVRAPWFDYALKLSMIALAGVYVVILMFSFRADYNMLGFRPLHAPKAEMLYGFGPPTFVRSAGGKWSRVAPSTQLSAYDEWRYASEAGGTFLIHFGGSGLSDVISCYQAGADSGACPTSFGVRLGDIEDRVAYNLGAAPRRLLNGQSAVMRYPSIGVEFELQQFKVRRITIRSEKSPVIGRIPRFLRFIIP